MRLPVLLALMAAAALITGAHAQSYPSKPVRWIVPSAPGDGSDITARLLGERVGRALGQPVVIDNKPGAGGVLGSDLAARSPADGYTMIVGNAGSHGINAAIYGRLSYDVVRDFAPVALICTAPNVMIVSPATKARSVAEFVAYARANPGRLNYASGGIGSSAHMSAELFKSLTGTEMTHVPYKGSAPAVAALLADEVSVMIGNLPPWTAHLKAGKVRALAVTTAARYPALPEVPAMAESLPGFETVAWFAVFAPAGTPRPVIERMNREINAALAQPEVRERLATSGCDAAPGTPEALGARVAGDVARWKKLAAEKNIRAD